MVPSPVGNLGIGVSPYSWAEEMALEADCQHQCSMGLADTRGLGRSSCLQSGHCSLKSLHRVHCDVQQVLGHLTHPRFTFTESETDADIFFHFSHFKDYT